jgi:hypothetical protein
VLELSEPIQEKIAHLILPYQAELLANNKDILAEKDQDIKEHVQEKLVEKIKYSPLREARYAAKQSRNLEAVTSIRKAPRLEKLSTTRTMSITFRQR